MRYFIIQDFATGLTVTALVASLYSLGDRDLRGALIFELPIDPLVERMTGIAMAQLTTDLSRSDREVN